MIVFGPIPSRRLGRSLGVNNIPSKHCSFSCTYCQAGRTPRTELVRADFHEVGEIVAAVGARVDECRELGEPIDYLSFVPDGEPTLDARLGLEIRALKPLGLPIAVITNGSMLWRDDVRADLDAADLVSIEVDTLRELPWRMLNRPNPRLSMSTVIEGIRAFARGYAGTLLTQTMIVAGVNDNAAGIAEVAGFLAELNPTRAFLAIPTRPPADSRVHAPDEATILQALATMSARLPQIELLRDAGTGALGAGYDRVGNLIATLTVHPMRRQAVEHYLGGPAPLALLLAAGTVKAVDYAGEAFVASAR